MKACDRLRRGTAVAILVLGPSLVGPALSPTVAGLGFAEIAAGERPARNLEPRTCKITFTAENTLEEDAWVLFSDSRVSPKEGSVSGGLEKYNLGEIEDVRIPPGEKIVRLRAASRASRASSFGPDLVIFFAGAGVHRARVAVSSDGVTFEEVGAILRAGEEAIDIAEVASPGSRYTHVRIQEPNPPRGEGFRDHPGGPRVDAVGALGAERR